MVIAFKATANFSGSEKLFHLSGKIRFFYRHDEKRFENIDKFGEYGPNVLAVGCWSLIAINVGMGQTSANHQENQGLDLVSPLRIKLFAFVFQLLFIWRRCLVSCAHERNNIQHSTFTLRSSKTICCEKLRQFVEWSADLLPIIKSI